MRGEPTATPPPDSSAKREVLYTMPSAVEEKSAVSREPQKPDAGVPFRITIKKHADENKTEKEEEKDFREPSLPAGLTLAPIIDKKEILHKEEKTSIQPPADSWDALLFDSVQSPAREYGNAAIHEASKAHGVLHAPSHNLPGNQHHTDDTKNASSTASAEKIEKISVPSYGDSSSITIRHEESTENGYRAKDEAIRHATDTHARADLSPEKQEPALPRHPQERAQKNNLNEDDEKRPPREEKHMPAAPSFSPYQEEIKTSEQNAAEPRALTALPPLGAAAHYWEPRSPYFPYTRQLSQLKGAGKYTGVPLKPFLAVTAASFLLILALAGSFLIKETSPVTGGPAGYLAKHAPVPQDRHASVLRDASTQVREFFAGTALTVPAGKTVFATAWHGISDIKNKIDGAFSETIGKNPDGDLWNYFLLAQQGGFFDTAARIVFETAHSAVTNIWYGAGETVRRAYSFLSPESKTKPTVPPALFVEDAKRNDSAEMSEERFLASETSRVRVLEGEIVRLQNELSSLKSKGLSIEKAIPNTDDIRSAIQTTLAARFSGITKTELMDSLNALDNDLRKTIYAIRDSAVSDNSATYRAVSLTNRIDELTGVNFTNTTVTGTFEGLTDAHIPDTITASNYLLLTGGALSASLAGTTATFDTLTVSSLSATSSDASSFVQASSTRLSVFDTLYVGGTATTSLSGDNATSTFASRIIAARIPSLVHTFIAWAINDPDAAVLDAPFLVNPSSAAADTNLFGLAVNNNAKFIVDAEGDIFANSLTTAGSVNVGATTMASLIVENNTTLGDASGDIVTVNAGTINFATSTIAFTGAATTTVPNLAANAWSIATSTTNTPVFTISTEASPFGLVGIGTSSPTESLSTAGLFYVGGTGTSTIENNLAVYGGLRIGNSTLYIDADGIDSLTGDFAIDTGTSNFLLNTGFISSASSTIAAPFHVSDHLSASSTLTLGGLGIFDSGFISSASSSATILFASDSLYASSSIAVDGTSLFALTGGNVGIGTTEPDAKLNVGGTSGLSGVGTYSSATGYGIYGSATAYGVYGAADTYGVYGFASGYGVYGEASTGLYGDGSAYGVYGTANDISGSGGYFENTGGGYALTTGAGNVGIGTTSPGSLFSVQGAAFINDALTIGGAFSATSTLTVDGLATLTGFISTASSTVGGPFYVQDHLSASSTLTLGGLGIFDSGFISSASSSATILSASDSLYASSSIAVDGNSFFALTGGSVGIGTSSTWGLLSVEMNTTNPAFVVSNQGSSTPSFYIGGVNEDGNVGIGTTSPYAKLSVVGETVSSFFTATSLTSTSSIAYGLTIATSEGLVGIGTSTPDHKLTVFSTVSNPQFRLSYDATRYTTFQTDPAGDFFLDPTGDTYMNDDNLFICDGACPAGTLSSIGNLFVENNVGIGTTTPNWALQVAGTRPFLTLSDSSAGTDLKHWFFSSQGGNLYIGTSTDVYATSTVAALALWGDTGVLSVGTTTNELAGRPGIVASSTVVTNSQIAPMGFPMPFSNVFTTTTYATSTTDGGTEGGSWTVPSGVYRIWVEVYGGGGGGHDNGSLGSGGGGGSGGIAMGFIDTTPGQVISLTLGRGGQGAQTAGPGINGGTTTFLNLSATGGVGGNVDSLSGGIGSGGDINMRGGPSMPGSSTSATDGKAGGGSNMRGGGGDGNGGHGGIYGGGGGGNKSAVAGDGGGGGVIIWY